MSPSDFATLLSSLKKLPGEVKMLIEKRIELFSLEIGERISDMITNAVYRLIGVMFLALGMILFLLAAAKYVGEMLDNEALGHLLVSAPLLLAGILFVLRLPRSLVRRTRDKMLSEFIKDLSEQMSQVGSNENAAPDSGKSKDSSGSIHSSEKSDETGKSEKPKIVPLPGKPDQ